MTDTVARTLPDAAREIDLPALLDDADWAAVFGGGDNGNTTDRTDACPPFVGIDLTPPRRTDVAEVVAAVNGENDEASWVGLFRLKDGRFLVATGSCDYTGWDCSASNHLEVAACLGDAITFGLGDEDRRRLNVPSAA